MSFTKVALLYIFVITTLGSPIFEKITSDINDANLSLAKKFGDSGLMILHMVLGIFMGIIILVFYYNCKCRCGARKVSSASDGCFGFDDENDNLL
mmetsp:Transcript_76671/g.94123  ORF Transcript_76671/g.94123 Transcript_76671/m.94123 type:complete len:95 (+) Transcript_76671:72-356(+)